jgi:hypothetical protein
LPGPRQRKLWRYRQRRLDAFLVGEGNVMINGATTFFAGGVYAEFVDDVTGAAFVNPVWFP